VKSLPRGWSHCTEKLGVEETDGTVEHRPTGINETFVSRQEHLLQAVKSTVDTFNVGQSTRVKRHDLYKYSWIYEILKKQPGSITPLLAEIAPNIMSCFGVLFGCMNCVMLRNVFDRTGIGCMVPCASNQGHACGNAWGGFLSVWLKSRSVVCTELYQQGRLDTETFLADGSFGQRLEIADPLVMEGYRFLATPFVAASQRSTHATSTLQYFAYPFMEFIKSREGLPFSAIPAFTGRTLIELSKPLLRAVAIISNPVQQFLHSGF
jgi:hypothetical protein